MGFFSSIGNALGGIFGSTAAAPNTKPNGGDGVQAFGGFLPSGEQNPNLHGTQKWVTYSNALNTAIVATGVRYFTGLLSGTEWHAEPNQMGGADAERAVDIVKQGLFNAQMSRPWSSVVRKAAMYRIYGFSLHEWTIKRRVDGMIVFADLQHRPQHTIRQWDKANEQEPWRAVGQLSRSGNSFVIPRDRLFYCVDDTLTDNPDGVGLMRHVVTLIERLNVLEGLEGVAYETDLRGMPIGRAPLAELRDLAGSSDPATITKYVTEKTGVLRDALTNIVKSPDKLKYLMLDSSTYKGNDPNVISAIQKWAFDLLKGDTNGLPDVNVVIGRLQFEIARVLGIEFAMVGGQGSGTYGMHEDKTSIFATNLQTSLSEIAAFATNDLARTIVALNGLDPETCTPKLVAEPISTDAIEMVCRSLSYMAQANLAPNDPARDVIRGRMHLPPEPEMLQGMLGMLPRPSFGGAPDPKLGEQDVPLDDLGGSQEAL